MGLTASDREILPVAIKPINYNLSLFDLEFGGNWGYSGIVKIDAIVSEDVDKIVINTKELEILDAEVSAKDGDSKISAMKDVAYDTINERATIQLSKSIPAKDVVLTIKFKGTMNRTMSGFYRAKYKPPVTPDPSTAKEGDFHYMFSTQFEACDARRAFPCFDEPNLKASFEFEIEIPEGQTALSNMPEKAVTKDSKTGLKKVSFERTPAMSTYLAAWALGDFTYVEAYTERKYNGKNMPVRVYTTRGLEEQGRFALEIAHKTVDYFSDIFSIEFPLPKSDLLAVHEFAMGAMENWGLVTYRTTAVLYDEKTSDARFRNRVAYVVAHELAHQWFGNLVTMDWWNELWLNEGFATWVGWLAVDHLHPGKSSLTPRSLSPADCDVEWDVWSQFVAEAVQTALQLDSLRASHPIEVPVRNALEVEQIFDHISYLKGSSVIRMLSTHLGQETFLRGVSNYLKKHAYKNARTKDLWAALSEASGKDVAAFMNPWIQKIGFPVVTVAEEPGQISVRQTRFLTTGDIKTEEDQTTWWVPLGLKTRVTQAKAGSALTAKEDTIRSIDDSFYKLNADQTGFYRTNYPPARLTKLGQSQSQLSVQDKIGLIGDATALAVAGNGTTAGLLTFLEGFRDEKSQLVWSQISSSLSDVRSVFAANQEVSAGLKNYTLKLVSPAAESVGWEFPDGEDYLTGQLRKLLLAMAGGAGHEATIAEGKKRFAAWKSGDRNAIHQNLHSVIFNMNVAQGGESEYNTIKEEHGKTTSVDGKEICLAAMGRTKKHELAIDLLDFVTSDSVVIQDAHGGPKALANNNESRDTVWEYTKTNWQRVHDRLSVANIVMDRWIKMGLNQYSDFKTEKEIAEFFKDKNTKAFERSLVVVSDTIKGNAAYKERDEKLVLEWLKAHGYA